jgi:hypothetical protein
VSAESLLQQLAAQREEILAAHVIDYRIPLVKPQAVLRFKAIDHATIRRQMTRVQKAAEGARAETELAANAAIIAAATLEVILGEGDEAVSCDLRTVAEVYELGAQAKAGDAVRRLFLLDGDLNQAAQKVMEHSHYGNAEADEAFAGES